MKQATLSTIKWVNIVLCYSFLLLINSTVLFAQSNEIKTELIVQFKPDIIAFPEQVKEVPLSESDTIIPNGLQSNLRDLRAEALSKTFPEFNQSDTLKVTRTGEKVRLSDMSEIFTLRFSSQADLNNAMQSLIKLPEVIFIEPNGTSVTHVVYPDDQRFDDPNNSGSGGQQWNLLNTGQNSGTNDADIDASEAWEITKGNSSTIIGIIDSGVLNNHEDLDGKVTGSTWSSDHGTHVAGIAAAKTNNNLGIAGIDWHAQIIDQPWSDDPGTYNAIMNAVNDGAQILNSSFGHCQSGTCSDPVPEPRYSTLVRRAYANAYKMNVLSSVSMGNYNTSDVYYPAGYGQGIIAVGATNRNDERWVWSGSSGSNTGNHIDVTAPGENIMSTNGNETYGNYRNLTGTSMSAPHITGIAGLLLAENSNLYNDDIENLIKLSAEKVGNNPYNSEGWNDEMGYGRVNAHEALLRLQSPYVLDHHTATGGNVYNITQETKVFFDTPGLATGTYVVKRNEVRKTVNFSYMDEAYVWCRGVATDGFSIANPNFGFWYGLV